MGQSTDPVDQIDREIEKVQAKIRVYKKRLDQLSEKKKKLQEQLLLKQLNRIAPDYHQARKMLRQMEQQKPANEKMNGGAEYEQSTEGSRDG